MRDHVSRRYVSVGIILALACCSAGCSDAKSSEAAAKSEAQSLSLPGVSFQTVLGSKYVSAQNNGGGGLTATATAIQAWELFSLIDINAGALTSGDSVFIQAGNGQFWQAVNGGGSSLNAASNNQLGWETFKIVKASGGAIGNGDVVGLQSSSGSWVSAQDGGGGPVFAYGGAFGSWEQLKITGLAGSSPTPKPVPPGGTSTISNVSFKTALRGTFLGAENNGGGAVLASATSVQAWETLSLIDVNGGSLESGDSVFIQAGSGQYFQAQNGGGSTLDAASNNQLGWETFKIVKDGGSGTINSGDSVGLQASSGSWISAENGGGGRVFAYGGALGTWERLTYLTNAASSPPVGNPPGPIGNPPNVPGQPTLPNGRGAIMSFVEYEAENMATNGQQLGPTATFGQSAAEASGRRAVRLASTGQYVQFTNATASNSIVVRYSIPDGGADYWTSLSVYVDGAFRTQLWLTSRYSWTYGGDGDFNQPGQNNPALGNPHHFYDEAHALVGDIPVGAQVMLRKDGGDSAGYYDVDLADMEQVPGPKGQPAGYLSLTQDCGARPDDNADDADAIQRCVDRARGEGRGLYIPQGVFNSYAHAISVAGVTIRGAGMWYSTVLGYNAHFDCWGNGCQYYDFAVFGDTTQRIDTSPETAFGGNGSSGVVLDGIWIEHTKTGYWPGPDTNGLTVRGSRIRDTFADGVNLWAGTNNSVIQNNHLRNTGDDAIAAWSENAGHGPDHDNLISKNYVQLPWKANCFALYGGSSNHVEDNVCADTVQYPGILLATQFNAHAFTGSTSIARNTLIRAGAWAYNQEQGAFKVHADQGPIQNVAISDLELVSPIYYGIHVQGQSWMSGLTFSGVTIQNPGKGAFFLNWGAQGDIFVERTSATGAPQGIRDDTGGAFHLNRGAGDSGF